MRVTNLSITIVLKTLATSPALLTQFSCHRRFARKTTNIAVLLEFIAEFYSICWKWVSEWIIEICNASNSLSGDGYKLLICHKYRSHLEVQHNCLWVILTHFTKSQVAILNFCFIWFKTMCIICGSQMWYMLCYTPILYVQSVCMIGILHIYFRYM